jgi:hypothetical protein
MLEFACPFSHRSKRENPRATGDDGRGPHQKPAPSDVMAGRPHWYRYCVVFEPIREVWIHDEGFAASRLSMMRIMARRTKAATVVA